MSQYFEPEHFTCIKMSDLLFPGTSKEYIVLAGKHLKTIYIMFRENYRFPAQITPFLLAETDSKQNKNEQNE